MNRSLIAILLACTVGACSAAAEDRGQTLFKVCATCHGDKGEGREIGTLKLPAIAGLYAWYTEAQLIKFQDGSRGAHPKDRKGLLMRPMSRTLIHKDVNVTKENIKAVAAYVEQLPRKASVPEEKRVKGDLDRGKYYYQSLCLSCHGERFEGNSDPSVAAPSHKPLDDWYMVEQLT